MSFFVPSSAGVYIKETDRSQGMVQVATSSGALVLYANKGPVGVRTLTTSRSEFLRRFVYGNPTPDNPGTHAALSFLNQSNQLQVVRVANGALFGGVNVRSGAGVDAYGEVLGQDWLGGDDGLTPSSGLVAGVPAVGFVDAEGLPEEDATVLFKVFGIDPGAWNNDLAVTLTHPSGVNSGTLKSISVTDGGSDYSANVEVIIDPPTTQGGVQATARAVVKNGVIKAITAGAQGTGYTASTVRVQIAAPPAGGLQAVATAILTGDGVTGFTMVEPGYGYTEIPEVVISDTGSGANATATVEALSNGVVREIVITNRGSGYVTTPGVELTDGAIGRVVVTNGGTGYKTSTTVVTVLDPDLDGGGVKAKLRPVIVSGVITSLVIVNPGKKYTEAGGSKPATISFTGDGASAAATAYVGTGAALTATIVGATVPTTDPNGRFKDYTFTLNVWQRSTAGVWSQVESFTVSRKHQLDARGRQLYLEDAINGVSSYVVVANNTDEADTTMPQFISSLLSFTGGSDGSPVRVADYLAGVELFRDPEKVDFRIFVDGGLVTALDNDDGSNVATVTRRIKDICESRWDCMFVSGMPYDAVKSTDDDTNVAKMIGYRNTVLNINSSFGALYGPWIKTYDQYSDSRIVLPAAGVVAGQFAYTDRVAGPNYVPAFLRRGRLPVDGLTQTLNEGQRSALADAQVNSLQTFTGGGNVIWDCWTLQKERSDLSMVHVRRMLTIIEKQLALSLPIFLGQPNNELTRMEVKGLVDQYLAGLAQLGWFQQEQDQGYLTVVNTSNSTSDVIEANQLAVAIFLKFVHTIRQIVVNVIPTRAGASFEELISAGAANQ